MLDSSDELQGNARRRACVAGYVIPSASSALSPSAAGQAQNPQTPSPPAYSSPDARRLRLHSRSRAEVVRASCLRWEKCSPPPPPPPTPLPKPPNTTAAVAVACRLRALSSMTLSVCTYCRRCHRRLRHRPCHCHAASARASLGSGSGPPVSRDRVRKLNIEAVVRKRRSPRATGDGETGAGLCALVTSMASSEPLCPCTLVPLYPCFQHTSSCLFC